MASTGTPIPQPVNLARLDAKQKYAANGVDFYVAGAEIKENFANDGNNVWSFEFIPLSAQSVTLADAGLWSEITSTEYLVPTLIRVEVDQEVNPIADTRTEEEKKKAKVQKLRTSATALCASYGALPSTDGALKVSFPQTKPPSGYNIDFTSVQSIMTAGGSGGKTNQITLKKIDPSLSTVHTAKDLGTASNYLGTAGGGKGWNDLDHGQWATAVGGAFPDEPGSSLGEPKHFHSRIEDNPSVVLSFLVYDWLKCMYLKPNISQVVKALKTPLTSSAVTTSMNGAGFVQPAYAEINTEFPVTFALCDVSSTGEGDPRNWDNYSKDPEGYRRQLANVFGYVPADMTLPNSSLVASIDKNKVVTTNGQSPGTLTNLFNALHEMNSLSAQTMQASTEVQQKMLEEISRTENFIVSNVDKNTGQPINSTLLPALRESARQHEAAVMTYGRAFFVMQNAKFGLQMSYALLNDRKMLTGFGVTEINDRVFELMPGHLYIPTRAATKEEILGVGKISTGQDPAAGDCDWTAIPGDDEKGGVQFFVSTKKPVVGHHRRGIELLAPAFAASSIPPSDANIYSFALSADGSIAVIRQTKATAGVNILEGHVGYQNLVSLITDGGNNHTLQWNCVARNNVSNAGGAYFRNMAAPVTNVSPGLDKPLACEWSLRCPTIIPPECPKTPIIRGSASGAYIPEVPAFYQPKFGLNNIKPSVDAAGNISFTLEKGSMKEELKFFDNHNEWAKSWDDAWEMAAYSGNIAGSTTNSLKFTTGQTLSPARLSQYYRAANGYTTGNLRREAMSTSTESEKYFETFAKGMANLNVNSEYMQTINELHAAKGITPAQEAALRAMVYNSWVFYSEDANGCTKLFTFSS